VNGDVGGAGSGDPFDGTAEHDVFAGGFEEVVEDGVVSQAVGAANGLVVLAQVVDVGDVAIGNGDELGAQPDAVGVAGAAKRIRRGAEDSGDVVKP